MLRYRAVAGRLSAQHGQVVDRHSSLSGRSFASRMLLHSQDTEVDPRVDALACRRTEIRSMLVAPLLAGEETLGVLKVSSSLPRAFDDGDVAALTLLAHSLSAALRHVRDRSTVDAALRVSEETRAELARVADFRTDLVGMLGHEVGTPLAVLMGATEMARDEWDLATAPDQAAYLDLMERCTARIHGTVRDVLVQVTADSGRLVARPATVDVLVRAREALGACGLDPAAAGPAGPAGDGGNRGDTAPVVAWVQSEHLDQMLVNLVSNAVKYGAAPTVELSTSTSGQVRVRVVDRGPGVPEEFEASLFDRFSRSEADRGRARGTGLGLAIVRELAHANGGEVRHERTPGGGATFVLELPAAEGLSAG